MQSWNFVIGKEVYWSMEFDIGCFEKYRENNRLEVKKAKGGLPVSLWETYSSMSNCHGGTIILGIIEKDDGSFVTTGLKDVEKLKKDFWNTINNNRKVSANLLTDTDIESYEVNNDVILVIRVPRAPREFKPVYINDDLFGGTFRRNGEGDYHCTKSEVRAMLRDQTEETSDMKVLEDFDMEELYEQQIEALEIAVPYCDRMSAALKQIIKELTDEKQEDTVNREASAVTEVISTADKL